MKTSSGTFRTFLREAEKNNERSLYWKAVIQSLADGIVALDRKNNVVEWSEGARRIFGYGRREAVGKNIDRLVGGPRMKEALAISRSVLRRNGPLVDAETVRFRKNGSAVDISISASPILWNGRVEGAVGIYRDISERRKKEREIERFQKELESLKEFNENIVNGLAEGIVLEDARGRVVFVNPAMERLLGFRAEELEGRDPKDFIWPEEIVRVRKKTRARRSTSTLETYETVFRSKDGTAVPVLVSARSLFEGRRFTGVLSAVTNISRQKQAEAELEASRLEAQAANAAKSEFLANMSHEIRTPMNGIIGMTELALDTPLSPVQREYLNAIRASSDSLLVLLNDILDFSKIEARMMDLEPIRFGLRDAIAETASFLALEAHRKGLELACRISPDVPDGLVGDIRRLRQVLINLTSNAIKFTERGEVVIDAAAERADGNHVLLHFTVTDTGIGIPRDKQRAIFQAFVQADGSTTRRYGGTGLGLAISYRLVELMGGRIWVESEPGTGSRFHFTARLGLQRTSLRRATPAEPGEVRNLPVLIVDDNATNRRILKEILKNWQMRPVDAASGPEALRLLKRKRGRNGSFALALVDANMPGMDGFDLVDRVRKDPALKELKIMILTSSDRLGDVDRCRGLGVQAYLTKPVKQSELLDAILLAQSSRLAAGVAPEIITRPVPVAAGPPLRILLAEDNPINQKVAVHILEKRGHRVRTAGNGNEVLDALDEEEFDVVLMDVQMPVLDGFEATARIRAREERTRRRLPVIALTAHALKGDRKRCLEAGMDDYVSKPLNPEELFRTLDRVVRGARKKGLA
jgi:two-component system, sensor histidine kinase and response regulator